MIIAFTAAPARSQIAGSFEALPEIPNETVIYDDWLPQFSPVPLSDPYWEPPPLDSGTPNDGTIADGAPSDRMFLAFSFAINDLATRPDRNRFFQILVAQYNSAPTSAASQGYFDYWRNFRQQVLAVNPRAALSIYFSAITTQNPVYTNLYSYPTTCFRNGDFICDDATMVNQYDPRPDDFAFYSPRIFIDRADWAPYGPGLFGRWPFYEFKARNWVLPQTTYLCRPIIDVANPSVRAFVANDLIQAITVDYPLANAISFDNGDLLRNPDYDFWPGKNETLSPYRNRTPDADFTGYLDYVRSALHSVGAKLIVNSGLTQTISTHADYAFHEEGFRRSQTSAEFRSMLSQVRAAILNNCAVIQRYDSHDVIGRLDFDRPDLIYFLAGAMLAYERDMFGYDPSLWNPTYFRFYPEFFLLPTWLGDPLGSYAEPETDVYARRFANGIVLLNAGTHRIVFTSAERTSLGLAAYGAPDSLNAKSAVIIVSNCNSLTDNTNCATTYQGWPAHAPIQAGDLNCDNRVNPDDLTPFNYALTQPMAYALLYPYCDRMAADMDGNGVVDESDYAVFDAQVFHGGISPRADLLGDMNCDGYLNNLDIEPFTVALVDPSQYLAMYPDCPIAHADVDGDGAVRIFDAEVFLDLLLNGGN